MDHRGVFLVLSFLLALIGCVVGFLPSTPKVFRRQHQLAMTVAPSDTLRYFSIVMESSLRQVGTCLR